MAQKEDKTNVTLYDSNCIRSLAIRLLLREKGLNYRVIPTNRESLSADLLALNPLCELPMVCVRHDPVLFDALIIADYLDERYPEPSLFLPGAGVRATIKLMLHKFQHIFIPAAEKILKGGKDAPGAKKQLLGALLEIAPVLTTQRYLLSDDFVSVIDCFLVALLWHLPDMGIESTHKGLNPLRLYLVRMCAREQFKSAIE